MATIPVKWNWVPGNGKSKPWLIFPVTKPPVRRFSSHVWHQFGSSRHVCWFPQLSSPRAHWIDWIDLKMWQSQR
jgi:hypothetical protein